MVNDCMNPIYCRFSAPYSPQNRVKAFPAALLASNKTFSGSMLIEQNPKINRAAWDFKQLAREQLRQPDVMEFIGRCFSASPQKFGQLMVSPEIKPLSAIIDEAKRLRPENIWKIVSSAGLAIELMKMRNRLLFEGPQSAFSYYDFSPNAQTLHIALRDEVHAIRIGLHQPGQHGDFMFHPKITALRETLRHRVIGKCLVLCESRQMEEALKILLYDDVHAYFSSDVAEVRARDYAHLVLFSQTNRLKEAVLLFRGMDVILLSMRATSEEGAYYHYTELEKSRHSSQGELDLGLSSDRT